MPAEHDNNSHSLVFGTKKCFVGHCKLMEWRNTRSAGGVLAHGGGTGEKESQQVLAKKQDTGRIHNTLGATPTLCR